MFRIVIWNIFFWRFEKYIALSGKKPPSGVVHKLCLLVGGNLLNRPYLIKKDQKGGGRVKLTILRENSLNRWPKSESVTIELTNLSNERVPIY